jgi:hypothetical protein
MSPTIESLGLAALLLVSITSLVLLLVQDWRWCLVTLFIQYIGVFVLVGLSWPVQMAVTVLLAGWMSVAVLWMAEAGLILQIEQEEGTIHNTPPPEAKLPLPGILFRFFAAVMIILFVFSTRTATLDRIPGLSGVQSFAALYLMGVGILHLGLTTRPRSVVVGLLTVIGGFEILYSSVEASALVAGLLAGVTLGLALIGAYLLLAPVAKENP